MTRFEKLTALIKQTALDGVAFNPSPNLHWLTGLHFHLMERPVVLLVNAAGEAAWVLPELETAKLEKPPFPAQVFAYGEDPAQWAMSFRQAVQALRLQDGRIGADALHLRLLEYNFLREAAPQADFVSAAAQLGRLRLQKDADEVAAMRQAVRIAEAALLETLKSFRLGMTEKELASELTLQLLRHGSDGDFPFPPIVSAGPNGANPHASPSARAIRAGDLLVIDWGARWNGYISDITRTFAVGGVDEESRRIHEIVRQANAAGRAAARTGVPCSAVDIAARQVIESAGYGKFFFHRTGHGIGLEAHEPPWMRGDNAELLAPGMAFTVEPGIYLAGHNGVRIEDDLVIAEDGTAETLTTLPRDLQEIG